MAGVGVVGVVLDPTLRGYRRLHSAAGSAHQGPPPFVPRTRR